MLTVTHLKADGHDRAADLLSHLELLAQDRQTDVFPVARGEAFTQPQDPFAALLVRLVLIAKQGECEGSRKIARMLLFLPPRWV